MAFTRSVSFMSSVSFTCSLSFMSSVSFTRSVRNLPERPRLSWRLAATAHNRQGGQGSTPLP